MTTRRNPTSRGRFRLDRRLLVVVLFALVLTAVKVPEAITNPYFGGDPGFRLHHADLPVVRLDNRMWLPFLQTHIWIFYLLGLPVWSFNLIPIFYLFAATALLGSLACRLIPATGKGVIFTLLLMFCFSFQQMIASVGVRLDQEIVGTALLYFLLAFGALELRGTWTLFVVAAAALMTRDSFWIYLSAATLLWWRPILATRRLRWSVLALWLVPILWVLSIPVLYLAVDGRFPQIPIEWPLMMNKDDDRVISDLATTIGSVWAALVRSKAVFVAAALLIVALIDRLNRARALAPADRLEDFAQRFIPFSLVSLAVIYALILAFDPWNATFGNRRMGFPLLEHSFVWSAVFLGRTFSYPGVWAWVARAVLFAGLLAGVRPELMPRIHPEAETARPELAKIKKLVAELEGQGRPLICVVCQEIFEEGFKTLSAPTLHAKRSFYTGKVDRLPTNCDAAIATAGSGYLPEEHFKPMGKAFLGGITYRLYRRERDSAPPPAGR